MKTHTEIIHGWIRSRLYRRNQNYLAPIIGQTGTGKSWTALSFCQDIDKDFSIDRVVFEPIEFVRLVNSGTLKKGSMILFDECGVGFGARDWYKQLNKQLSYILQTFRHQNYGVLFTMPVLDFIDIHARKMFHAYMETRRINRRKKLCILGYKSLEWNSMTKKLYKKYPRIRDEHGRIHKIKEIEVNKPKMPLIRAYEKRKKEFTKRLNEDVETSWKEADNNGKKEPNMRCTSCEYEWNYYGKLNRFKCPSCGKNLTRGTEVVQR